MIELVVKVSDSEQTLTEKFLIMEEGLSLSHDDTTLKTYVDSVVEKFKTMESDINIKIKTKMDW